MYVFVAINCNTLLLGIVVILGVEICFCLCWIDVFCFLVSVALSGSQESMLPGSCLVGNACTERGSVEKASD